MSEIETPPLQQHPKVWDPATLVLLVILCVFGAIIGVQLLVSLGVTPNTAIIGAMAAMIVARVPPRHGRADVYRRRARHAARRVPAL